jgi:hypothetical protein
VKAGAAVDTLPHEIIRALAEPFPVLGETPLCERLDRLFERWSRDYAFSHLASISLFPGSQKEAVVHFWHACCELQLAHRSGSSIMAGSSFIGPSDDRGAFSINRKAAFLSAAVRELKAGCEGGGNGLPQSAPLFLTAFPAASSSIRFFPSHQAQEGPSFLNFRPLSADFVRIYKMEPIILAGEKKEQYYRVYLLTADQKGFSLLSAKPFPDKFPLEMTLGSDQSMRFVIDSIQKKQIYQSVEFCHVNFERFLPSKIFDSLKEHCGNERREHVRLERSLPVEIELSKHKRLYAITDNISVIGARIVHTHAIPPGIYLGCRVRLGGDLGDISFRGLLVWKKNLMTNLNMAGIKFIKIEDNDKNRLMNYLQREIIRDLLE